MNNTPYLISSKNHAFSELEETNIWIDSNINTNDLVIILKELVKLENLIHLKIESYLRSETLGLFMNILKNNKLETFKIRFDRKLTNKMEQNIINSVMNSESLKEIELICPTLYEELRVLNSIYEKNNKLRIKNKISILLPYNEEYKAKQSQW